jgi:hypothetical protein
MTDYAHSQTGTSTTFIYPFKWYSIASSTGTGAKYATTTDMFSTATVWLAVLPGSPADFGKLITDKTEKWAKAGFRVRARARPGMTP